MLLRSNQARPFTTPPSQPTREPPNPPEQTHLKSFNPLNLLPNIIALRLKPLDLRLHLIDDLCILQHLPVLREVDRLRLIRQHLYAASGVVVALFEGREGVGCAAAEAQLGG